MICLMIIFGLQFRGFLNLGGGRRDDFEHFKNDESLLSMFGEGRMFNLIFNKLNSFYSDPRLRISNNNRRHTMIATVLMLEYACILFASPSCPTREEALDEAYSHFMSSGTHEAVNRLFLSSLEPYSPQQFTEFILTHRLR